MKTFNAMVAQSMAAMIMGAALAQRREIADVSDTWLDRIAEAAVRGAAAIEAAIPRMEEKFAKEEEERVAEEERIQKAKDDASAGELSASEAVQVAVDSGANALEVAQVKQHAVQSEQDDKNSEAVQRQGELDAKDRDKKEADKIAGTPKKK